MLAHEPSGPIPSQIGPYRILRPIGEGGMGAVYLAEQDHPHRHVALKVIRADVYTPQHLRRFEHEAEMLGRLQHPGIAQIYQAGTHRTAHGLQPYFAMEYVQGQTLDEYAREHKLGTRERLELAAKICDAIEHAHQKGVIHRDLKPGNILVTSDGQPKILDFGVARITDADIRTTTLHTDIGVLVGTLTYMSPEQASGDPDQLDTRSDVYSLGVVIFELLTGQLPYRIDRRMVPESVRAIREDEPSRLSTHDRTLRGDVETIVAKTLEKDKARRYASASALASDIRHYLADEPIAARPPSAGYQLSKFARRNKVLVGGVAAFFLALVAGAIVAWAQMVRARSAEQDAKEQTALVTAGLERATLAEKDALAQRDRANGAETLALERLQRAEIEQKKAEESAEFLVSLFGGIDPYEAAGADTTLLRRILAGAAERISTELAGQPEVEASIRLTLGKAYTSLAAYDEADEQLQKAEAFQLELFGEDDRRTFETRIAIVSMLFFRGEHAEAEQLARRMVERQIALFGPGDRDTLRTQLRLGDALTRLGRWTEAEATLREALARTTDPLEGEHSLRQQAMLSLALALQPQGKLDEAEELLTQVLDAREHSLGRDGARTIETLGNLAIVVEKQGRYAEAEAMERDALERHRRVLGAEHPQTLHTLNNLAVSLDEQGRFDEAEITYRECLELRRRALGARHPDSLFSLAALARFLLDRDRRAEAMPILIEALEGQRAVLGEDHTDTLFSKFSLAKAMYDERRFAEAAKLTGEIADNARRTRGESDPSFGIALYNWAAMLQNAGDREGVEKVLREVLALREKYHWKDEPYTAAVVNGLGKELEHRGEHAEADALFEEALAMRRRAGDAREILYSVSDYGESLLERGDLERAEPLLRELVEARPKVYGADHWSVFGATSMLGRCLAGQGRFSEAEPLLTNACERLSRDPDAKAYLLQKGLAAIVRLYEEWDETEPGAGHAASAATWRARAAQSP